MPDTNYSEPSNLEYPDPSDDVPRFAPWVQVLCSAFVPVLAALLLPARFLAPMFGVAALLFATAMFMLWRESRRVRA